MLSLIDLFTHWLSTPMDSLILLHTISSINLLSDLFSLSSQFEWMLDAYLDLTQTHPQEDVLVESLLVFGVLKSAVVLRVNGLDAERVAKIVENSLSQDSFINTQNSCLEGMLYVIENAESAILSLVGPTVARYTLSHLELYQNYSEYPVSYTHLTLPTKA